MRTSSFHFRAWAVNRVNRGYALDRAERHARDAADAAQRCIDVLQAGGIDHDSPAMHGALRAKQESARAACDMREGRA